jgi:hypothetical protein
MLNGMTDKPAGQLAPIAKSWLKAAGLKLKGRTYASKGYDQTERAYHLVCKKTEKPAKLDITIAASEDSPVYNPAFVIERWGRKKAALKINGKKIAQGKDFRYGYKKGLESDSLVVWFRAESTKPVKITISPTGK